MSLRRGVAVATGWYYRAARRLRISTSASRQAALHDPRLLHGHPGAVSVEMVRGSGRPLRVLLVGNGAVENPGLPASTASYSSFLAQSLSSRTSRPVVVTVVRAVWELPALRRALRDEQAALHDALVVSAAYRPRLAEIPLARWESYAEAVRAVLVESAGPHTVIRVLSLPWREAAREAPAQWGGLFGNRLIVVADIAEATLRPDQRALPLRLQGPAVRREWVGPAFSAQTYLRWADQIAAELARSLEL